MSLFFFDSSALVKRYLSETGSAWVTTLLEPANGHTIVVATITQVETAAAIATRHRANRLTQSERESLVDLLARHFDEAYQQISLVEPILSRALDLTQRYRLRGYDAVQVATALFVSAQFRAVGSTNLTIVSADEDVNVAARAAGLTADNPNGH